MNLPILERSVWGLLVICLCLCGNTRAADNPPASDRPVRYVIGLSPFLDRGVKDDVYRRIVGFLLEDVPLNSSVWVYDAYHIRTITQATVPNVRAFQSAKTRANQFKKQIRKLKDFLAADLAPTATNTLMLAQAVRFPQFMDFVGDNLTGSGQSVAVIVLGNPLYLDPKEPGFSMVDGYFPSDGHLLASRDQSVFGIKDRAETLTGIVVQFGFFEDPWVSEIHREKIGRFWALYLKGQGARLGAFCGDLPTVFNAARLASSSSEAPEKTYEIDRAQSKIEMLRISRDIGVADWLTRDVLANSPSGPPSITVGPMKIGIRWRGNLDLDLYSTPRPHSETLYFERTRSPEGYYFKDHRTSPEREYEFIEFETPVDVWQVEALVNFYEGRSPGGLSGEVRIEFEGKIFAAQFSLAVSHGNKGRSGRSQGEYWTRLDVPAILKLRDANRDPTFSQQP